MSLVKLDQEQLMEEEVLLTKKDLIDGVVQRLKSGETEGAIQLYRRCHEDVGYELMNLIGGGPLAENLAKLFLGAKDFYKAAQVFEKQGRLEEAAKAFEQAEAYDSAADIYGRTGNIAKAGEMLERGGSSVRQCGTMVGCRTQL